METRVDSGLDDLGHLGHISPGSTGQVKSLDVQIKGCNFL